MKDPLGVRSAGLLVQRITVGGLMLFHGIHKLFHGVGGIQKMLEAKDLPGFIAYGVFLGEILGPLMVILGFKARIGAALIAFTMVVSIPLAFSGEFLKLTDMGAPVVELNLLYLLGSVAIIISGAGTIALDSFLKKRKKTATKKKSKSEE